MTAEIALAREVGRAFAEIGGRRTDPLVDDLARVIFEMIGRSGGAEARSERHLSGPKAGEQAVLKLKDRV